MTEYNGQCVVKGCEHHFVAASDEDFIHHFNSEHGTSYGTVYQEGGVKLEDVKSFEIALSEEQRQMIFDYESE